MKEFSLLQQLEDEKHGIRQEDPFAPGTQYQEYTVEAEKQEYKIYIPLRECEAFEQALSTQAKYLDREDLRRLLRKYRGIRL